MKSQADARLNFEEMTEGLAGATVEVLRADLEQDFVTKAEPELLLAFIKELCEGHFVPMQDILHRQLNTLFDIDLVFELYSLLLSVESNLDHHNIKQAELACQALTELLQGNTSGVVSQALMETKLIELCDRLLVTARNSNDQTILRVSVSAEASAAEASAAEVEDADGEAVRDASILAPQEISKREILELREEVLTLLHALLETNEASALARMEQVVDLRALANLAGHWHDEYGGLAYKGHLPEEQRSEAELAIHSGFMAILLLRRVTDERPSLAQSTYGQMSQGSLAHYEKYVGRVEMCGETGELERIYFRVPFHFLLAPRTKEAVLWGVDRETPGQAVQEFLLLARDLHVEVMWQQVVGNYMLWKMVVRFESYVNSASVVLAIVQNVMLLIDSTLLAPAIAAEVEGFTPPPERVSWGEAYVVVRTTFALTQIITCSLAATVTFGRATVVEIWRKWIELTGVSMAQTMHRLRSPWFYSATALQFLSLTFYVILRDAALLGRLAFVAFAVCGAALENGERYFVIHLIQVVLQNKGLMDVLRAVTQNGKQLMLTTLLVFIVIWMFAVWGFEMRDKFITPDDADEALCRTPGHCWLEIVNSLASGDVGDLLMNRPRFHTHQEGLEYWVVWLYQILLFVIVVVILLNVVFGIIIDTFGELRGEKAAKKAHMENTCFICGIDRFTFETKGKGFDTHIRKDHNMWTYLAMMIHTFEKDPTEYNGWETYVASKLNAKDPSFMPRNTALVLQASLAADEAAAAELNKRIDNVEAQNRMMISMMESLARENETILEKLSGSPAALQRLSSGSPALKI